MKNSSDINKRPAASIHILLCEGSSLSAREAITTLGPFGYYIDVCDPNPLCLGRFSRFVKHWYRSPAIGTDPEGYLAFLLNHLQKVHYDVLLPVQEQAFLFAKVKDQLQPLVGLAITDFTSFIRLQSKANFTDVLDQLAIPHPTTTIVRTKLELVAHNGFPYFLKTAYGTATSGVWLIKSLEEQTHLITQLEATNLLDGTHELLVQEVVPGPLHMVQAVFEHGRLVAAHCWQQIKQGARGSSCVRVSVDQPLVIQHMEQLGQYLCWYGCLAIDYILDPQSSMPLYIDANPRLVECMNATLSGTNIAELQVRLSLAEHMPSFAVSRAGVRSHMLMMSLLGLAERGCTRRALVHKIWQALRKRGVYTNSREELTPTGTDVFSLLPLCVVGIQLLINPLSGTKIAGGAVTRYALTQQSIQTIQEM